MRLRPALPALLCAALAACGPARVRVAYPAADSAEDRARAKALSQVYLVFGEEDADAGMGAFASALDAALKARGGAVLAYRAAPAGDDPFLAELAPSAVLAVGLSLGPLTRTDFEREVAVKDKDGKEEKRKAAYTRLSRALEATASLRPPGGGPGSGALRVRVEESEEKPRAEAGKVDAAAWTKRHGEKLVRSAARRLALALPSSRVVTRERVVYADKEDRASTEAAAKAGAGDWEAASALWAGRLEEGRGGWRDVWNLAVAAEQRQAYAEAARLFTKAGAAAGSDPEAAKVPFAQAAQDAERGAELASRSERAAAYFARPVAVLPFSDDTVSVDGPANLRRMTAEALRRGGYAVQDLEETDAALRRRGFSQGGQLARGRPEDFSRWTGAERLVFAHVAEFRNVMLGFLGRREVAGRLWVWDAAAEAETYAAEKSAVSQDGTADGAEASARLAEQLGKALLEAWRGRPLAAESTLWVVRSLSGLPLRPAPSSP